VSPYRHPRLFKWIFTASHRPSSLNSYDDSGDNGVDGGGGDDNDGGDETVTDKEIS
jgi:hypothetical protein